MPAKTALSTWLFFALVALALVLMASAPFAQAAPQAAAGGDRLAPLPAGQDVARDEDLDGLLPRWPDTGRTPDDPGQSLVPYAIDLAGAAGDLTAPTSGLIASPPEYAPCDGVIYRYTSGYGSVVINCVATLTGDPAHDEIAYVVVPNATQQATAASQFAAAGADLSKVVFIQEPSDSVWLRDYGPHFIFQDGARAIVDSHYYPTRPLDNFIPTLLADDLFVVPSYPMGLYYSGGNFQPGPNRSGFITSLIFQHNPEMSTSDVTSLYRTFQGIDTLHIMPRLPSTVDGTGHIDMWMYLVDETHVIISEFLPGSNATAIQITNDAVPYMQALGFTVTRTPAWNVGSTHYTYTNAYRVNDRIFVPTYGSGNPAYLDDDATAMAAWAAAAGPGVELVPINCYQIIPSAGAIHCIVMQVPRHADPLPSAAVITLDGGQLACSGHVEELRWAADDDVGIQSVDISYSTDNGVSFPHVVATGKPDTGRYDWLVPDQLSAGTVVRVSATDTDGNVVHATSAAALEITQAPMSTYDFSKWAGVDRWGWGSQSSDWSVIDGQRHPAAVSTPIDAIKADAYATLAQADAVGGDTDANRYISPAPSSANESTHIFEFTLAEDPSTILDIGLVWEGYGDACLQMELYVWDNLLGNWGDGAGQVGLNHYVANWAGNRDEPVIGHIRSDFGRYVDGAGRITLLAYAERNGQKSFHDYVAVKVASSDPAWGHWADLGLAAGGAGGPPSLVGSGGLVGGEPIEVGLVQAARNAATALVIGLSGVYAPFKAGVLVPSPDLLVSGLLTDTSGSLALSGLWPPGLPAGLEFYMQAWIADPTTASGLAGSNGIVGTTP